MKFNVEQWEGFSTKNPFLVMRGLLHIRTTDPGAKLFASNAEGETVLVGMGCDIKLRTRDTMLCSLETKEKEAYRYAPKPKAKDPEGEVYTNADRQPLESGTLLEVRKAARQAQLEMLVQRRALEKDARRQKRKEKKRLDEQKAKDEEAQALKEAEAKERAQREAEIAPKNKPENDEA